MKTSTSRCAQQGLGGCGASEHAPPGPSPDKEPSELQASAEHGMSVSLLLVETLGALVSPTGRD